MNLEFQKKTRMFLIVGILAVFLFAFIYQAYVFGLFFLIFACLILFLKRNKQKQQEASYPKLVKPAKTMTPFESWIATSLFIRLLAILLILGGIIAGYFSLFYFVLSGGHPITFLGLLPLIVGVGMFFRQVWAFWAGVFLVSLVCIYIVVFWSTVYPGVTGYVREMIHYFTTDGL